MAEEKSTATDPFSAWRDWLAQAERQINSFYNNMMGSEEYTRSMGQFNELSLNMQKSMNESLARYLSSLNLPARDDLAALAQRLDSIEQRLRAIEGERGDSQAPETAGAHSASAMPRPPRTKRPATTKSR